MTPEALYLSPTAKLPYCRGCGHSLVVRATEPRAGALGLPPRSIVLTTDIGCVGLADSLFPYLHTVHTTHGRSTAFATGMALADAILEPRGLKPIVMIGDGGAMIGLLHLVHAAQLNVDVTVLIHNNFMFGMTGGQHSGTEPLELGHGHHAGRQLDSAARFAGVVAHRACHLSGPPTRHQPGIGHHPRRCHPLSRDSPWWRSWSCARPTERAGTRRRGVTRREWSTARGMRLVSCETEIERPDIP